MATTDDAPKKFDLTKMKVTPVAQDAPAKFDLSKVKVTPVGDMASPQIDFTNTIDPRTGKGYGLYKMTGPDGTKHDVPYNQVMDASKAGLKTTQEERERYAADRIAELKKQNPRFTEGQFRSMELPEAVPTEPGMWQSAEEGVKSLTTPTNKYPGRIPLGPLTPKVTAEADLNTIKRVGAVLFGIPDMGAQAWGALKSALSPDPVRSVQGQAQLMQMHPAVQFTDRLKELKQEMKTDPKLAGENVAGDLIGMWLAGKVQEKVIGAVKRTLQAPRATLEAATDTSPRGIREIAEDVQKKNEDATQVAQKATEKARKEYEAKKAEDEHTTQGREIAHKYDVQQAAQKIVAEHRLEVAKTEAHNARVHAKALEKFNDEAAKVRAENQRVMEKHAEEQKRVTEENKAAENALELRRAEEEKLRTAAQEQSQKYADAEKKANDDNDAAWDKVRSKTAGHSTDISQLQKITEVAAEQADPATSALFKRIIKGEKTNLPSLTRTLTANKYVDSAGTPVDRMSMSSARFDDMVARGEIKPVPATETVNPDDPEYGDLYEKQFGEPPPVGGGPAQFNRLQRWYTYISDKMYGGVRVEAGLYNAYEMVRSAINDAMQDIAKQANATTDLEDARKTHTEKMETFSDSPNEPQTVASKSLQEQIPEQVNEKARAERLKKVARYDPSILDTAANIDNIQKRLKAMKTEEQLRTSIQKVPPPPTVGDLRPGYNLSPNPPYQPPTVGDLRPGYELKPKPALPGARSAIEAIKEAERVSPGPEPPPVQPETKTISPEDYQARKMANIKATARNLRATGLRRGIYATLTGLPFAVIELFKGAGAEGAGAAALGGVAAGGVVLAGSHMLANLLEHPEVSAWLSKFTPKDAAGFEKLTPEQKALFTQDMTQLVDAAKAKGIKVSPALTRFIAGAAVVQTPNQQTLDQVKKQGEQLQAAPPAPVPAPPAPGPQSSIAVDNLKKIIAQAEAIKPGSKEKPVWSHEWDPRTNSIVAV
jgi:hypothetical protein